MSKGMAPRRPAIAAGKLPVAPDTSSNTRARGPYSGIASRSSFGNTKRLGYEDGPLSASLGVFVRSMHLSLFAPRSFVCLTETIWKRPTYTTADQKRLQAGGMAFH